MHSQSAKLAFLLMIACAFNVSYSAQNAEEQSNRDVIHGMELKDSDDEDSGVEHNQPRDPIFPVFYHSEHKVYKAYYRDESCYLTYNPETNRWYGEIMPTKKDGRKNWAIVTRTVWSSNHDKEPINTTIGSLACPNYLIFQYLETQKGTRRIKK